MIGATGVEPGQGRRGTGATRIAYALNTSNGNRCCASAHPLPDLTNNLKPSNRRPLISRTALRRNNRRMHRYPPGLKLPANLTRRADCEATRRKAMTHPRATVTTARHPGRDITITDRRGRLASSNAAAASTLPPWSGARHPTRTCRPTAAYWPLCESGTIGTVNHPDRIP